MICPVECYNFRAAESQMGLEQRGEPPAGVWDGHWGLRSYTLHGPARGQEDDGLRAHFVAPTRALWWV